MKVDFGIDLLVTPPTLVHLRRIGLSSIDSLNHSIISLSPAGIYCSCRSANVLYLNSAPSAIAIVRRNIESS